MTAGFARTISIAVYIGRINKSIESRQKNILFPAQYKNKTHEERKLVTQLQGKVMPIKNAEPIIEFCEITDKEKAFSAFKSIRQARTNARSVGIRAK